MFEIRKATSNEIPIIRELTFKVWPQTYASILSKEQIDYMLEMMYSESSFKLHKIYVLTSQQGKGTGRFLIDYIISQIRPMGATSLQLQVNRDNAAKSFYEKLGFVILKEADFDIGNGYFMRDYVMEKKL